MLMVELEMDLRIIPQKNYKRATWKNGLGFTDEVAIFPEDATLQKGDFLWRLSSARIEKASPFSEFPRHDRTLVILKGEGVRLFHADEQAEDPEAVELGPLEPYDFPGDVPSRCEMLSGPVTDLSIFVRKAEAEAVTGIGLVDESEPFEWIPPGRWNFAFAADGLFEVIAPGSGDTLALAEGDTLEVILKSPLMEGEAIRIVGSGTIVWVGIQGE